jgi:ribonucleoside-diphosphate reductase beta chain
MHLPDFGAIVDNNAKRMVFGPPTQALLPLKYPAIYDAYKASIRNSWTPEEVGLSQDRYDYQILEPAIKNQWDRMLSMLTTMDMVVTDAVGQHIAPYASAPEFRAWLARQAFEEANHSDSYAFIIDGIGLNQREVFDRYLQERSLYAKIQMADIACGHLQEGTMEGFLKGYAFFPLVLEGLWFFLGLCCGTYATYFHRKMLGTTDQFMYILRDEVQHISTGLTALRLVMQESDTATISKVRVVWEDMLRQGWELEKEFAKDVYVELPHLQIKSYMEHSQFRTQQMASRVGLSVYPDAKPQLTWLDEVSRKKEKNFFERRVDEYQVGADLQMEEVGGGMPDGLLKINSHKPKM